MKTIKFLLILTFLYSCSSSESYDAPEYFELVNKAEQVICYGNFDEAVDVYKKAFQKFSTVHFF